MLIRTRLLAGALAAATLAGGTGAFAAAHGTCHARPLPHGDLRITASIGGAG